MSPQPTNLYPKKKDVNTENTKQFSLLDDEPSAFEANDVVSGPYAQAFASKLDKDVQAAKSFDLKVGAQVLLLVNMDMTAGLVNGSRGVVRTSCPHINPPTDSIDPGD